MALQDVDWINLAVDKHRWLDVVKSSLVSRNAGSICTW